jgi:hypothetical protein
LSRLSSLLLVSLLLVSLSLLLLSLPLLLLELVSLLLLPPCAATSPGLGAICACLYASRMASVMPVARAEGREGVGSG